jgi:PKD repeat protein
MMQKIMKKILLYQILMILTCLFFVTPTNAICSPQHALSDSVTYVGYNFDPHFGNAPLTVHFTVVTTSPSPIIAYVWDFGDGKPPETTPFPEISHTYTAKGSYTAQVTAVNECGFDKKTNSQNTIEVTAPLPPSCPSVTANIIADKTSGPAPLAVTFHDQSQGVTQVQWDFGDNQKYDSLGGSNQPHTYTAPGSYTAVITVKNACGNIAQETIPITVQQSQPTTGSLSVSSNPSGASVYVDTVYQGTTPVIIPQLAPGSHTVLLTLTGYTDYDTTVNVYAGQTPLINHPFTQSQPSQTTGSLQVSTTPSGATIILDGNNKGQTPATLSDLSTGDHTVKLTRSGYWDSSQTVHIDAEKTTPLDITLVSSTQPAPSLTENVPTLSQPGTGGSVIITSNPPGANVYLDGKSSGTTPVTLQNVNPGTRTILLTMQGYSDASRTIEVTAGSQNQISVDLIGGKKTPGFEAALAVFSITGLVLFRMLYRKEE